MFRSITTRIPQRGKPFAAPPRLLDARSSVCPCPGAEVPPPSVPCCVCAFSMAPQSGIQPQQCVSPGTAVLAWGVCVLLLLLVQGASPGAGRGAGLEAAVKTSSNTQLLPQTAPLPRGQMCHCGPDTGSCSVLSSLSLQVPWDTAPGVL